GLNLVQNLKSNISLHLKEQTELPELKDKPHAIEQCIPVPESLENDFIPEEILLDLTTMTSSCCRNELGPPTKTKTPKEPKLHRFRPTDPVWHHPLRRTKFKHLIDQPISLAQAGRDISFLCDAIYSKCPIPSMPPVSIAMDKSAVRAQLEKKPVTQLDVPESLIPDEYHIVKNKGVLGLEYYEDKYTTLLQDHEKNLRLFPSMKPSGRVEAIQLSQVMDTMLEKVGVNDDDKQELKGETQMHHLLDLVKKEQDIYNVVFHELIRQISVDCAERGELLAKIRERYVSLLDYIPRQLNSMHNEIMMQRMLDRQLIVELFLFQNAVEKLNGELGELRERDRKATKTIEKTQEELSNALIDAHKNANMLVEYHQLYELQRKRLIAQVGTLIQEKDWWSGAAYSLALKVIEENGLKLVRDLEVSEKLWSKVAQHFVVVLGTKDAEDQTKLQQITMDWRKLMTKFSKNLEDAENSSLEKRKPILSGFKKWHKYFSEIIVTPQGIKAVPKDMLYMLKNDLKDWHEMITQDYERYEGLIFLTAQETLLAIVQLQNDWTDLSLTLFERHRWSLNEKLPEQIAMEELNNFANTLSQRYTIMLTGENGIAWYLMRLQDMLESFRAKFDYVDVEDIGLVEFNLLKLNEQFPTLINLLEEAMKLAETPQTEEEKKKNKSYVSLHLGEVIQMIQDWLLTLFKMITHLDTKLSEQVAIIHRSMSHLLIDLLLNMVHDPVVNVSNKHFKHLSTPETAEKLEEKALMLASQLNILSTQMYSWCKDIVETLVKQRAALHLDDPDNELKELEKLKVESTEWINICEILLSDIKQQPVHLLSSRSEEIQSHISLTRDLCNACSVGSATKILEMSDSELSVLLPEETETVEGPTTIASFYRLNATETTEGTEKIESKKSSTMQTVRATTETGRSSPVLKSTASTGGVEDQSLVTEKVQAIQSKKSIMHYIGNDTNIHEKDLKEPAVPIGNVDISAVIPVNAKSMKAYEELAAMGMLQQQLIQAELRALQAEELATSLDDRLQVALDKIKDLTLELQTKELKEPVLLLTQSQLPSRTASAKSIVEVAKPTKTKSSKTTKSKTKK
uniref:axonemal dynein light chain domain-containing protein 1 n=1 Tax=Pristiophorus japonicus TaxID=55135 RepID=UPI00398EAF57